MKKWILVVFGSMLLLGCKASYLSTKEVPRMMNENAISSAEFLRDVVLPFSKVNIVHDDFVWGINGHSMTSDSYKGNGNLEEQIELMKAMQLSYYRMDVMTSEDGEVNVYNSDANRWQTVLSMMTEAKIKILPVFQLRDYDYEMSIEDAYQIGMKKANGFALRYGDYFDYYALGNERDLRIIKQGRDGDYKDDYNYDDFIILASFLKGMHDGIKNADPSAKTIINCSGWKRWGYYELLKEANVTYDLIGWHWYSNAGTYDFPLDINRTGTDVLDLLHDRFEKPIWITEINQHQGTFDQPESTEAFWIKKFVDDLDGRDYIKAFFVYELLDQPHLNDGIGYEYPEEAFYGLFYRDNRNNLIEKAAVTTLKFKIEEVKYGTEDFVYACFKKIHGNTPNNTQLMECMQAFKTTIDSDQFISGMLPKFNKTVLNDELDIKDSTASIASITEQTLPREEMIIKLLETQEFWYDSVRIRSFVSNLYSRILDRNVTEKETEKVSKKIEKGRSKASVANALLNTREYREKFITKMYKKIFGKECDELSRKYWVKKMKKEMTQNDIIKAFFLSKEFYNQSIMDGYQRRVGKQLK